MLSTVLRTNKMYLRFTSRKATFVFYLRSELSFFM